jgi:putative ABC transport system permease protein
MVAERDRELSVRSALVASPRGIAALVVRQGMTLAGLGIVLGVAASVAVTRALASLLFGVTATDSVTYTGAIALVAAVSLIACAVPAARAARVDPSVALRAE